MTVPSIPLWVRVLLAAMCLLAHPCLACAQDGEGPVTTVPGDGVVVRPPAPPAGHGWMIASPEPTADGEPDKNAPDATLLHLPPRGAEADGVRGVVRFAAALDSVPTAIASWNDTAYLVDPPHTSVGVSSRRVLSVTALPGIGGAWFYSPGGRPRIEPSLPGSGVLRAFGASAFGPLALLRSEPEGEGEWGWRLLILASDGWKDLALPWQADGEPAPGEEIFLLGRTTGFRVLIERGGGDWTEWSAEVSDFKEPLGDATIAWTERLFTGEPGEGAAPGDRKVLAVDGQTVLADWLKDDGLRLALLRPDRIIELTTIEAVPMAHSIAGLDGGKAVAVMWSTPDPDGSGIETWLHEVSVSTGDSLYAGEVKQSGPVSAFDLQVLSVMLLGIMAMVILFVLRPEPGALAPLPPMFRSADPGRRLLAALIDAGPGVALGMFILPDGLTAEAAVVQGSAWTPLVIMAGLVWLHTTIGEWLFGRSLGKALFGCRVIVVQRVKGKGGRDRTETLEGVRIRRPTLAQAAIRNFVRWAAPPLCVLAVFDPAFRHPGDLAAGTLVVTRRDPERDLP